MDLIGTCLLGELGELDEVVRFMFDWSAKGMLKNVLVVCEFGIWTWRLGLGDLFCMIRIALGEASSAVFGLFPTSASALSWVRSQRTLPFRHIPMMSALLFLLSRRVTDRVVIGESGLEGNQMPSIGDCGESLGDSPMFLRISSFGAVAISTSRGVKGG